MHVAHFLKALANAQLGAMHICLLEAAETAVGAVWARCGCENASLADK